MEGGGGGGRNSRSSTTPVPNDDDDDAFGDNRISVTLNDVYRLIRTLGVAHYGEGGYTRAVVERMVIDTS